MPRAISSTLQQALAATLLCPAFFIDATFRNETVYVWTGVGNMTWNGNTYTGLGSLLEINTIQETASVEAKGVSLTCSGLDSVVLPEVLSDFQLGQPCDIYLALLNPSASSPTFVDQPILSWGGRMDKPTLSCGGATFTITIQIESRLIDMNVSAERRYTQADQTIDYPGDLAFSFQTNIQNITVYWGNYPQGVNNFSTR